MPGLIKGVHTCSKAQLWTRVCVTNQFCLWLPFLINMLKNDEDTQSQIIISSLASEAVEWTDLKHQRSSHTVNTHAAAFFVTQCRNN